MKIMTTKAKIILASLLVLIFATMMEHTSGTISVLWEYTISDFDGLTKGHITKSEFYTITERQKRYGEMGHNIVYAYSVQERLYINDRINFNTKSADSAELLKKYPVGKQVKVYFDSENPNQSTLEKSSLGWFIYLQLLILLSFAVAPFVFLRKSFLMEEKSD